MGLLGSFFGSDQRKDLRRAKAASDRELDAAYKGADEFYAQGQELYDPYIEQGRTGSDVYSQAIGLGTPEERAAAQERYFSDPAMQAVLGQQTNALLRKFNASGSGTGGGRLALAGTRVGLENYGSWLDRVKGVGDQGFTATTGKSNVLLGRGDSRWGYGATKAGQETSFGNAMAQNRSTGINNLLNVASLGVKAYAASDIRLKRDVKRIGALPSGLPVYFFRYRNSDTPHIGVMAHEAAEIFPDAVATSADGYGMVDYSRIG